MCAPALEAGKDTDVEEHRHPESTSAKITRYCCSAFPCATKKPEAKPPPLTYFSAQHTEAWRRSSCRPSSQPMYLCVLGTKPSAQVRPFRLRFPLCKSKVLSLLASFLLTRTETHSLAPAQLQALFPSWQLARWLAQPRALSPTRGGQLLGKRALQHP